MSISASVPCRSPCRQMSRSSAPARTRQVPALLGQQFRLPPFRFIAISTRRMLQRLPELAARALLFLFLARLLPLEHRHGVEPAIRAAKQATATLRRRSASAASWSGSRADPTEYKVAARALRPIGGLSSVCPVCQDPLGTPALIQLDRRKPIQALTIRHVRERPALGQGLTELRAHRAEDRSIRCLQVPALERGCARVPVRTAMKCSPHGARHRNVPLS